MILFEASTTTFYDNGLGRVEPIKCIETKKKSLNGWYIECEFPIKYKDVIQQDCILFAETKEKGGQPFRVNNINKTDRKIIITANHVAFDSERYVLIDVRPTQLSPVSFLNWINSRTDTASPFTMTSDVSGSGTKYFIRTNLLDALIQTENLFGGSYDADIFNIALKSKVGNDDGFALVYGKNIQSASVIEDWSTVCTRVIAVGHDELMLPEKYIDSEVQYENPFTRTVKFNIDNDIPEAERIPFLREMAERYLQENMFPKINYIIKSDVDQSLKIGDLIKVKHPIVTIETEVQSYTYDVIKKRVLTLEFGNYTRDVKKVFDQIKDAVNDAQNTASNALEVSKKQSEIINNLNKRGLVYIDDNEILILDKLPRESASQVWRFGLGGIGFSNNGYEGPFEYALTQDGHFNIDFIQANSITVNKLAADVGSSLDLSSNQSISLIVEDLKEEIKNIDITNYHADLDYKGTSITKDIQSILLTTKLLDGSKEVATTDISFNWKRVSKNTANDTIWNNAHKGKKSITITSDDLEASANFSCTITVPEGVFNTVSVTIVDETDSAILNGLLVANQPDNQTIDINGGVTPKWGLTLTPALYDGSLAIDVSEISTLWKRKINGGNEEVLSSKEIVENNVLTVTGDILSKNVYSVSYLCYIAYKQSTIVLVKSFTLLKDGSDGLDGVSLVSNVAMFAVNQDKEIPPIDGWISSQPMRNAGWYLWQKFEMSFSDGSVKETVPFISSGDDAAVKSETPPTNTTLLWLDTSITPNVLKQWNGIAWVMINNQIGDINNAVDNVLKEVNKTTTAINENVMSISKNVEKIGETVESTSGDVKVVKSQVLELEKTKDQFQVSIDKFNSIDFDGYQLKEELRVYMRFFEENGLPNLELGGTKSNTKTIVKNDGMHVLVNNIAQTVINSSGLNTPKIITKKIELDGGHGLYTNNSQVLIIQ